MLERITEAAWDSYPRPSYSKDCRASEEALRSFYSANDLNSARDSASKLTWAIGNDHRGTYYPALLGVLPFLEDLLRNGTKWPKPVILGFMCPMLCTFQPEPGYEDFTDSSGRRLNVENEFKAWLRELRPLLSDLAQRQDEAPNFAQELLEDMKRENC